MLQNANPLDLRDAGPCTIPKNEKKTRNEKKKKEKEGLRDGKNQISGIPV
jgi:hypothetical protein